MSTQKYSSANTIKTVAGREISVLLRSKGIMFTIALTLIFTIGGTIAASYFMGKDEGQQSLAVVGMPADSFEQAGDLEVSTVDSPDAAKQAVKDGTDAALIAKGTGPEATYELLSDGTADPEIVSSVSTVLAANAQNSALESLNVNPQDFNAALPASTFTPVDISKDDSTEANIGAVVTVLIGVSLLSFIIMLFAGNIGSRVTEEKSSRVVEIILASVRPLDFLAGKLLANALMGIAASVLILGAGAIAVSATGLLDDFELDLTVMPMMALSFILGLLFFGGLYAAAGSMVSRTEDLQSTQAPILIFVMGMIYAPLFGWSMLDSTVMQVLTWIPPFSLTVAPVQYASGNMSMPMVMASFAVAAVATVLVMLLVAKIYRNAILHNGSKLTWAKALKGS